MRLYASVLGVLLFAGVVAAESHIDAAQRSLEKQVQAAFEAHLDRLSASQDAGEQSVAMLYRIETTEPDALAEASRRWALSNPDAQAVKLLAALSCQWETGTPQRAICDEHRLMQRWQRLAPTNAYVWSLAAAQALSEGDGVEFERSSARLLASDRFDTAYIPTLQLMRDSIVRDADYSLQPAGERALAVMATTMLIAMPRYAGITEQCPTGRANPIRTDRSEHCRHLAKLMIDRGREGAISMLGTTVALAYAKNDEERAAIAETQASHLAVMDRYHADPRLQIGNRTDTLPDALDEYLQLVIAEGDVNAMVTWLARQPDLTESERVETSAEISSAISNRAIDAYLASLATSTKPNELALSTQLPFGEKPSSADIEERIRRWEQQRPNAEAVKLLAALSCSEHSETMLQRACSEHRLLERWQQVDTSNAVPWIIAAQHAQTAGENNALAHALSMVNRSDRLEWQQGVILRVLLSGLTDLPATSFQSADQRALTAQGIAIGVRPIIPIHVVCPTGRPAPVRPERKQTCLHLSQLLTARSSEIGDASYGHVIATAYSDDPQTIHRREEWSQLVDRFMDQMRAASDSQSVPVGYAAYLDMVIAEGEVFAVMEWLDAAKD